MITNVSRPMFLCLFACFLVWFSVLGSFVFWFSSTRNIVSWSRARDCHFRSFVHTTMGLTKKVAHVYTRIRLPSCKGKCSAHSFFRQIWRIWKKENQPYSLIKIACLIDHQSFTVTEFLCSNVSLSFYYWPLDRGHKPDSVSAMLVPGSQFPETGRQHLSVG